MILLVDVKIFLEYFLIALDWHHLWLTDNRPVVFRTVNLCPEGELGNHARLFGDRACLCHQVTRRTTLFFPQVMGNTFWRLSASCFGGEVTSRFGNDQHLSSGFVLPPWMVPHLVFRFYAFTDQEQD